MNLPDELIKYLKSKSNLFYDYEKSEAGFVGLINYNKLTVRKIWVEGNSKGDSYYEIPAINLTSECESYPPDFILLYLPNEKMYGTWDSDHWILYVFPNVTWAEIAKNPLPYIDQQWLPNENTAIIFDPKEKYELKKGWPF